jgi:hypothetical protein
MAHFAKLDENNNVIDVTTVNNDSIDPNNEEETGIAFLIQITGHSKWKQTSYNNNIRKKYAGIGMIYNEELDGFHEKQPYESWTLDLDTLDWKAPIPYPPIDVENYKRYQWNEEALNWEEIQVSE